MSKACDLVVEGYHQSASMIQSQVAIIKLGLQKAINSIKDLRLKKRVNNIVCSILRKVFIHSVTAEIEKKYRIKEIISQGSFSIVKRAMDKSLNIEHAVKFIVKNA